MNNFRLDRYLNPNDNFDDLSAVSDKNRIILDKQNNFEITERSIDKINELIHDVTSLLNAIQNEDFVAQYAFSGRKDQDEEYLRKMLKHLRLKAMKLYDNKQKLKESINEFKKYKGKGSNPCWDGYRPGAKTGKKTKIGKSGKRVANCEKISESDLDEQSLVDFQRDPFKFGKNIDDIDKVYTEPELYKMQQMREGDPKKGTGKKPKGSGRRLYTDENPKDTVSVKFRTKSDIQDTFSKKSFKAKSHKRQSQIINLVHQRVRAAYKNAKDPATKKRLKKAFDYAKKRKEASKKKTERMKKKKNESVLYRLTFGNNLED